MTILETLKQLRDDIKTWVTNNLVALNEKVDNIEGFSGDYNDLTNRPEILEDSSDSLHVVDQSGNIILKVNENGLTTTSVQADEIMLNGQNLSEVVDNAINNAQVFSGDYNDLTNKPDISNDESDSFIVADNSGNIILDVDASGVKTTAVSINGEDVATKINAVNSAVDSHAGNKVVHITAAERDLWNSQSNASGDYNDLINKPNILDDKSDSFSIVDSSGNVIATIDENGINTTALLLNGVNFESTVNSHTDNKNIHVTTSEKDKWNNANNILDDQSGELCVSDNNGNIIFRLDKNGIDTVGIKVNGVAFGSSGQVTGSAGDFVVIGEDGNMTTKTIIYAEEATFGE